jgi:adenine-specific DNA-methyltransferase
LGEYLEDEDAEAEHFGLFWPGKREARRLASRPSEGTLPPQPGLGVDEETTHNLFIEGENLEVLKLLQKSYAGRVKMIYIDPPYNTGQDFIYPDDFAEPLESYLKRTGQADEEGQLLTTNTRASGRFHSNWLSMMYPRLRLARQLLRDDGIIFVSIDDNEVCNLRYLMDEVFGEENFVAQIVWKNKYGPGAYTRGFAGLHEYIICYSKETIESIESPLSEEEITQYAGRDDKYPLRGGYVTQPLATKSKADRPNLVYPIEYEGHTIWPDKQWVWSRERMEEALRNNDIVIRESDGEFSVRFKQYLRDEQGLIRRRKPLSILIGPYTQEGTNDIENLFGERIFDFPKPTALLKQLFSLFINGSDNKDDLILDFFAGSGTTAQAILELNHEDDGRRRFILVQLPEPSPDDSLAKGAGYLSIVDVGRERIRRVIAQMEAKTKGQFELNPDEDLGFKCYRLGRSNYKPWQDVTTDEVAQIELTLDFFESPLVEGWQPKDLLTEILLTEGFPLDSRVVAQEEFTHNQVHLVTSNFHQHRLFICLDDTVAAETIAQLALQDQDVFVCLDTALTDEVKIRLSDTGNIHVI